jgi:hypothetical protein
MIDSKTAFLAFAVKVSTVVFPVLLWCSSSPSDGDQGTGGASASSGVGVGAGGGSCAGCGGLDPDAPWPIAGHDVLYQRRSPHPGPVVPMVARKGRASYLGERSAGHQDPGATSAALLFEAAAATLAVSE